MAECNRNHKHLDDYILAGDRKIVHALDRSMVRLIRRANALDSIPTIQNARLKRQAYYLAKTLLQESRI